MKKNLILIIIIMSLTGFSHAQQSTLDFKIGTHLSKIKFHHSTTVQTDDDDEFQSYDNSNFMIGFSAPISKKSWFLKTALGYLKTNTFYSATYDYDEGFGVQKGLSITYLTNQKLFLSISPEYRANFNSLSLLFNGGVVLAADVSNTMSTTNTVLLPKSSPLGLKLETGLRFVKNNIGVELSLAYMKLGKSQLQNIYHPKISYDLIMLNFGIVYSI